MGTFENLCEINCSVISLMRRDVCDGVTEQFMEHDENKYTGACDVFVI